ncbi:MAG TPA: lysine--tRNA ligase [Polyangiaceae bacterium]|jgi:lysyl-tRNA synthetase class 2|nr:lysine--tRNA ligase [Polyangiaceae bacterium]
MKADGPDGEAVTTTGEEALFAARRQKADAVRARGENPFANDVGTVDRVLVHELRERLAEALLEPRAELRYDPEVVARLVGEGHAHLAGRLMARRGFGKAVFLNLRDYTGELQIFAKKDSLGDGFAALDDLDIGDHVEVVGLPMVTKKGELSIEAKRLRLLTKAVRPLPDKWHGLTDVEARYRHRYVDFVASPDAALVIRARSLIVQALREFLDGRGFVEVETPTLHSLVGGAAARPFVTHHNALDLELFLRIAPELYLKRLLVGGFERVYEIGRCYRNEGISTRHNPEFTMLEFYEAYATYETLMPLTEALFRHADRRLAERLEAAGHGAFYRGLVEARGFTFDEPFARVPMNRALVNALEAAGLPPSLADGLADLPSADGLVAELRTKSERASKIDWSNLRRALAKCDSDGDRVFVGYEYFAEPFLVVDYRSADGSRSVPVFIIDYPAETSPLARRKDTEPSLVDRFELFVEGRELCNAFSELNDPDDQAARFRDQVARKARGDEETMDYDEDYVRALEHGMPPAAGFGLGVDRLAMTLLGQQSIRDVIAFPLLRPEPGHT